MRGLPCRCAAYSSVPHAVNAHITARTPPTVHRAAAVLGVSAHREKSAVIERNLRRV